jgi:putative hydrolase of HD superfamily
MEYSMEMALPADEFVEKVITLFERLHPLERIPRAGFLLRGVSEPETVAAHSHFLATLALLVMEHQDLPVDRYRVLAMALVHDLPEAQLMDIAMPYADAHLKEAKGAAEHSVMQELFRGFSKNFVALHQEFAEGRTLEARLLRGLDKVQMMIKVLCYEREHRGYLEEFWKNPKNFADYDVDIVRTLFDAICARAGRTKPKCL